MMEDKSDEREELKANLALFRVTSQESNGEIAFVKDLREPI